MRLLKKCVVTKMDAGLNSIKISDARTNHAKRLRVAIHTINMFLLGVVFMVLLRVLSALFEVQLDAPIRQYGHGQVLLLFGSLLFISMLWVHCSFNIVRHIFKKMKI